MAFEKARVTLEDGQRECICERDKDGNITRINNNCPEHGLGF